MALIDCPECQHKISEKANSCPHCGYPLVESRHQSAKSSDFTFLTPISELAAMVEGLAAGLRQALHPEGKTPREPKDKAGGSPSESDKSHSG